MASLKDWGDKVKNYGLNLGNDVRPTSKVYSEIRDLRLRTVEYESIEDIASKRKTLKSFLRKNKPCLFIWDPLVSELSKGYIFDTRSIKQIDKWVKENEVSNYSYLITSKIEGIEESFMGSVFSDGKGKVVGEIAKIPFITNHRELSQPKGDIGYGLNFIFGEDHELVAADIKNINSYHLKNIINMYSDKKGYFEFTYGDHLGNLEIVTVGYEKSIKFDDSLIESMQRNAGFKLQASIINQN